MNILTNGSESVTPNVTLLFAHGGGFCKEIWDPIIRRVKNSPLFHGIHAEFVTFDFPYHGTKRDESVAPKLDQNNPKGPRVTHPVQDMVNWTSKEVQRQVQALQTRNRTSNNDENKKTHLIGVGHSMGAVALWKTEVEYPGTFDGLILFEPVYDFSVTGADRELVVGFLVSLTLQRESKWPSREAAHAHLQGLKNFAKWDRESLAAYIQGALVEESDGSISLACHPHIEAALYCHYPLLLSEEEQAKPKSKISFHHGARTKMFIRQTMDHMEALHPHIYKVGEPIPNTSHAMVLENPALSAARILTDLQLLPPFRDRIVTGARL